MTTLEAKDRGIKIGLAETPQNSRSTASPSKMPGPNIPQHILGASRKWPLVNFKSASYYGGAMDVLCVPNVFEVNNAEGGIEATREQVCTFAIARMRYSTYRQGSADLGLGSEHTQESGSNP